MTPTPDEIRAAREAAQLTQAQAAALVFRQRRAWGAWERGEWPMPSGLWALFLITTSIRKTLET